MTKPEAVDTIVHVSRQEVQPTRPVFVRLLRALDALGLSADEQLLSCRRLDIVRADGTPFGKWHATKPAKVPWRVA